MLYECISDAILSDTIGGGRKAPSLLGDPMDYDDEIEPALAIHPDIQIISIGVTSDVLMRIDIDALELSENPHVPEEVKHLPMWALRSNVIGEAINSHYEMLDLRRTWNEE